LTQHHLMSLTAPYVQCGVSTECTLMVPKQLDLSPWLWHSSLVFPFKRMTVRRVY